MLHHLNTSSVQNQTWRRLQNLSLRPNTASPQALTAVKMRRDASSSLTCPIKVSADGFLAASSPLRGRRVIIGTCAAHQTFLQPGEPRRSFPLIKHHPIKEEKNKKFGCLLQTTIQTSKKQLSCDERKLGDGGNLLAFLLWLSSCRVSPPSPSSRQ